MEATRLSTPVVSVSKDDARVWRGTLPQLPPYYGTEAEELYDTGTFYRFPHVGQPSNVSVLGDEDYDDPLKNITTEGQKAVIDGQGAWEINGQEITFTPEEGFNGKPTFPRIAAMDFGNVATWANYLESINSTTDTFIDKDIEWYLYHNIAFVVPEDVKAEAEKNPDFDPNTPDTTPAEDLHITDVEKLDNGNYKVTRNDGESWTIDLSDLRNRIDTLEKKESPSKEEFDKIKDEIDNLKKEINDLKAADETIKGDITNIKTDIANLDDRITTIESRLTVVEGDTAALTKCVAGAGAAGIPALLSIPLMMMTQLNIPGIKDLNTQVQKQIGMHNPELARQWKRNGGVLQAGAALATLAGIIGGIAYLAKQCDPMMQTPAGQDTDLGKLSSKLDEKGLGSSQKEKNTEAAQPGEQDAEAAKEADTEDSAETATALSEELVDAQ